MPAPGMDLLLPRMGTLCLGWRCCSQDCQPAPRTASLLPRWGLCSSDWDAAPQDWDAAPWMGMLLLGLQRCSLDKGRAPQEGKLRLGLGTLPGVLGCSCSSGLRCCQGCAAAAQPLRWLEWPCGVQGSAEAPAPADPFLPCASMGMGDGHRLPARHVGYPCVTRGAPLHYRQQARSVSSTAPSCARSRSPTCRSQGHLPQRSGRASPGKSVDYGAGDTAP